MSGQYPKVAVPLLNSAEVSIDIIVFAWRFYPKIKGHPVTLFNQAIFNAVKRGVRVRCLVNSEQVCDTLKKQGCQAKMFFQKRLLHTKLLVIDGDSIILGSHNYTQHAFSSNHECSVFFKTRSKENAFVQYFNNLFGF